MRITALFLAVLLSACSFSCATAKEATVPSKSVAVSPMAEPVAALGVEFDPNAKHRVARIVFDVEVSQESASELAGWIDAANEQGIETLVVEFNTPGGDVEAGMRLGKVIEESKTRIVCITDGMAASMGIYLMQSCHDRMMTGRSMLMAHAPSMGGGGGNAESFGNAGELLRVLEGALAYHVCHRMTIPAEDCKAKFAGSLEWWIGADEALAVGAVDAIAKSVPAVVQALRKTGNLP